jgi:methyltransferase (TIGR00027 family)
MSNSDDFVSLTASFMAAIRALETEREHPLFQDPFAAQLAGSQALEIVKGQASQQQSQFIAQNSTIEQIIARTRFFDDFLMAATLEVKQVIILAAGMDTRVFRLPWVGGIQVYELDKPSVLEKKIELLQDIPARCRRCVLPVDLTKPWFDQLVDRGYQANVPSVWLLEGLLMYLHEAEVLQLLTTIAQGAAPGSQLGADLLNNRALKSKDMAAQYWHFGTDYPETLLPDGEWSAEVFRSDEETAKHNRIVLPTPLPSVTEAACGFWIKAKKLT